MVCLAWRRDSALATERLDASASPTVTHSQYRTALCALVRPDALGLALRPYSGAALNGLQHNECSYLSVFLELVRRVGNAVPAKCGAKPNLQCGTAPKDSSGVALCCVVLCCVLLSNSSGRFPTRYVDSAKETSPSRCMLHDVCLHVVSYVARCTQVRVPRRVAASDESGDTASRSSAPLLRSSRNRESVSASGLSGPLRCPAAQHTTAAVCRPTDLITARRHFRCYKHVPYRTCTHDTVVHVFKVGTAHCAPAPLAVSGFAFGRSLRRPVIPTYRCNADRPSAHSTAAGSQHRPRVCVRV